MTPRTAYLQAAERVLAASDEPLSAAEILSRAQEDGLLPDHLYGRRQDRTLQARLSEDIARYGEASRFFRTAPGQYHLRAFKSLIDAEEYFAKPRRKELPVEGMLVLEAQISEIFANQRYVPATQVTKRLEAGEYSYRDSKQLNDNSGTAINSFVMVHDSDCVLAYRRGKFFPRTDPLYGQRSIGFGGPVLAKQMDLLYHSYFGVIGSAIEELQTAIGLTRRLAERARYQKLVKPYLAVLADAPNSSSRVIHIVLGYECPEDFRPSKAALSVNDLQWINAATPPNDLFAFDSTSRCIFELGGIHSVMASQVSRL